MLELPWELWSRIVESQDDLGWNGPLELIQSNLSAMTRDIFNKTRLLRAVCSPIATVKQFTVQEDVFIPAPTKAGKG